MNYQDALKDLQARSLALLSANAEYAGAYKKVDVVAYRSGALSNKQKELIALLLGIMMRCDDCTVYHAKRCVDVGISRAELVEGLLICVQMGGGPALSFGSKALAAFDSFAPPQQS
jgi:AhpD family alkylhydroperoxidase